jgi:uncharacterized protein DUF2690
MSKNTVTRLGTAAAATLALAAPLTVYAPAASAATSCYASSCTGLDPSSTTCQNDAQTVMWGSFTPIELRYSPSCRAAWARLSGGSPGDKITVKNSNGTIYTAWVPSSGARTWTRMVNDAGITSWACDYETNGDIDCTEAY